MKTGPANVLPHRVRTDFFPPQEGCDFAHVFAFGNDCLDAPEVLAAGATVRYDSWLTPGFHYPMPAVCFRDDLHG